MDILKAILTILSEIRINIDSVTVDDKNVAVFRISLGKADILLAYNNGLNIVASYESDINTVLSMAKIL